MRGIDPPGLRVALRVTALPRLPVKVSSLIESEPDRRSAGQPQSGSAPPLRASTKETDVDTASVRRILPVWTEDSRPDAAVPAAPVGTDWLGHVNIAYTFTYTKLSAGHRQLGSSPLALAHRGG
jgi:hypothetical protein